MTLLEMDPKVVRTRKFPILGLACIEIAVKYLDRSMDVVFRVLAPNMATKVILSSKPPCSPRAIGVGTKERPRMTLVMFPRINQ